MKKIFPFILVAVLTAFALLTLFLTSSVIFDWFGIRAKEGNYVPFVVWANFICGLLYVAAAYGLLKRKRWSYQVLGLSAAILIAALAGLLIHINKGGIYETKTIWALFFRIGVTSVIALLAFLRIKKSGITFD